MFSIEGSLLMPLIILIIIGYGLMLVYFFEVYFYEWYCHFYIVSLGQGTFSINGEELEKPSPLLGDVSTYGYKEEALPLIPFVRIEGAYKVYTGSDLRVSEEVYLIKQNYNLWRLYDKARE